MSMKNVIHRTCLCIVSTDDVFSFIFRLILVAIMSGARNCRDPVRSHKLVQQNEDALSSREKLPHICFDSSLKHLFFVG